MDTSPKKPSLWRAGLKTFEAHWRQWAFVALIFFFILAAQNGILGSYMEPMKAQLKDLKAQKDPHALGAFLWSHAPMLGTCIALMLLVVFVEHYLFFAFYMGKEMPLEKQKPSIGGFFCFLGMNILVWCLVMIPTIAGMVVSIALMKAVHGVFAVGLVASFALMAFLSLRLYSALPLAAAKIKGPLKASWEMTRGKCWRLFGNTLMITLVLMGFYLAILVVSVILGFIIGLVVGLTDKTHLEQVKNVVAIFVRCIVGGGFGVLVAGIGCAYASVVCRVLYQEKKSVDPTLILTMRR